MKYVWNLDSTHSFPFYPNLWGPPVFSPHQRSTQQDSTIKMRMRRWRCPFPALYRKVRQFCFLVSAKPTQPLAHPLRINPLRSHATRLWIVEDRLCGRAERQNERILQEQIHNLGRRGPLRCRHTVWGKSMCWIKWSLLLNWVYVPPCCDTADCIELETHLKIIYSILKIDFVPAVCHLHCGWLSLWD